jgi:hypothetical protein
MPLDPWLDDPIVFAGFSKRGGVAAAERNIEAVAQNRFKCRQGWVKTADLLPVHRSELAGTKCHRGVPREVHLGENPFG